MPKIIENIRTSLLEETKKQIMENGYSATTIRSVASACGLATGTVYNYFPSKDMLIATFMLEDWQQSLRRMSNSISSNHSENNAEWVFRSIYSELQQFIDCHSSLFQDQEAAKAFASAFSEKHKLLRSQLAEMILPLCTKYALTQETPKADPPFLAEFIAEALLTWTVAGKPFEQLFPILHKLIGT